jgi:hypothetical protein
LPVLRLMPDLFKRFVQAINHYQAASAIYSQQKSSFFYQIGLNRQRIFNFLQIVCFNHLHERQILGACYFLKTLGLRHNLNMNFLWIVSNFIKSPYDPFLNERVDAYLFWYRERLSEIYDSYGYLSENPDPLRERKIIDWIMQAFKSFSIECIWRISRILCASTDWMLSSKAYLFLEARERLV